MKQVFVAGAASFGAAFLIFMVWMSPAMVDFIHLPGSLTVIVIPLLLVFSVVWAFWWVALLLSRRNEVANLTVWTVLLMIVLRDGLEDWVALKPGSPPMAEFRYPSHVDNIVCALALLLLAVAVPVMYRKRPSLVLQGKRLVSVVLVFVAIPAVFSVAQLIVYASEARDVSAPKLRSASAPISLSPKHPRIVWVIMDELSYQQIYGHRYYDLQMPAFDQLAKESTVFTDVRPEGKFTEYVVPSLISGIDGTEADYRVSGVPLSLKDASLKKWVPFNPRQTVFQDAVDAGYQTAVAGWWIPYCRLLPGVLNQCFWTATTDSVADMNSMKSVSWNLRRLVYTMLTQRAEMFRFLHPGSIPGSSGNQDAVYRQLVAKSDSYLRDPSLDFIYIHLNVPHPVGFYDRHTGKFSHHPTTYIDNLALADIYLGHLLSELKSEGSWDNTTLVIMGDHSWRTNFLWDKTSGWTHEEQIASDGDKFDDRPGYIVHMAGQVEPERISAPYKAIRTRAMFDAMMRGEIVTPEQLQQWAQQSGN